MWHCAVAVTKLATVLWRQFHRLLLCEHTREQTLKQTREQACEQTRVHACEQAREQALSNQLRCPALQLLPLHAGLVLFSPESTARGFGLLLGLQATFGPACVHLL